MPNPLFASLSTAAAVVTLAVESPAHTPSRLAPASEAARAHVAARQQLLTPNQVEALVLLGRVWGFAKYHHPRITSGGVDWDAELLHAIPLVMAAGDARAVGDTIDAWLRALGTVPTCSPCANLPSDAAVRADIDWIRNETLLGPKLSEQLERIYVNRSVAPTQRYVSMVAGIGNPTFASDSAYVGPPPSPAALQPILADQPPPADLRLLAVFRFWNILEYWFPYRDLMERDRVAILREFVPAAWNASSVAQYHQTMMRLVARAQDTHANLWSSMQFQPPVGTHRVAVTVRWVEGRFVVSRYADETYGPATGLRRGDVIVRIDGAPVDSLARVWSPFFGASNDAARQRNIAWALTKGAEGPVRLDIERDGKPFIISTSRVPTADLRAAGNTTDLPGSTFRMLDDSVAYLKLSTAVRAEVPAYIRRAAGASVLVIDIRNYPKEFMVFALGRHLMPEPRPFARFTNGETANPGAFTWRPVVFVPAGSPRFMGRVVILVDETSQSQAEYTAMAFRAAPGAIVVGSTTSGADGNTSPIPLPGGLLAMISGVGVFYPDKRPTQQVGIVPDLEVRPTIAGIRSGRDEVLEAAVTRALGREFRLAPSGEADR